MSLSSTVRSVLAGAALSGAALVAIGPAPVQAAPNPLAFGFSGYYAPQNWRITNRGSGGGSVLTAGAPASIALVSPNLGEPPFGDEEVGAIEYTIRAAQSGNVQFDWNLIIGEFEVLADQDPFGVLFNGVRTQLSDNIFDNQNDTYTLAVNTGDVFGFYTSTFNGQFGPSTTTISRFTAPVPGPLPLLGVAAAFRASRKLRVLTRKTAKRG